MRVSSQSSPLTRYTPAGCKRAASEVFDDEEARQRLVESTLKAGIIPSHVDADRYADTLVRIQEAARIDKMTFDLSECDPLSLTALDIRVAVHLLNVVNRFDMKLLLPAEMESIPGWLLLCDRVAEVDIPDFRGDKIDLRDWTLAPTAGTKHLPVVDVSTLNGRGFPLRIAIPEHIIIRRHSPEIQVMTSFDTPADWLEREQVLELLDEDLRNDARTGDVEVFIREDHWSLRRNWVFQYDTFTVALKPSCVPLLLDHYATKHHTDIVLMTRLDGSLAEARRDGESFIDLVVSAIEQARAEAGETFRRALLSKANPGHWLCLVYLREPGDDGRSMEGIYVSDSLGKNMGLALEQRLAEQGLNVLCVTLPRQVDDKGCLADAFVAARDLTARSLDGRYEFPRALAAVARDKQLYEGVGQLRTLPDILLKTVEYPPFLKSVQRGDGGVVYRSRNHGEESIKDFRDRYTVKAPTVWNGKRSVKDMLDYLRQKGFGLAETTRREYWRAQMRSAFGADWTPERDERFTEGLRRNFEPLKDRAANLGPAL
jgi:hypothetical protein